ncbi:GNAT family N-acetyltransferase [Paenibacillus mendelii]|uniref:GNAT family N-acetyltransferase n=1 Tax=Paenibacillus mendelii TaxID=206163 RepID=A0ABV6J7I7_9BACL|nr:GNAT family N-acetyltransferase [Paenibacillus mendelii]MCQ6561201.1 GNAT family N-acetyltransferase [Paenibacillus mendelii]
MNITTRLIEAGDPEMISEAFQRQGWEKPEALYHRYVEEQRNGERVTLIAEADGEFAGYVNVIWSSSYPAFRENRIPEINDFNVLIKYRRRGIGSILLDEAEGRASERSGTVGIGVGLFADYGPAQVMYVKRGYIPDGKGIYCHQQYVAEDQTVVIDHDIALYLTKKL